MSQRFYLLFALAEDGSSARVNHVTGLDGGAVSWASEGGFLLAYQILEAAEVARLFPDDFGDQAQAGVLGADNNQLAKVVSEFQAVHHHIARHGPLVSFRFGTMVVDLANLWAQIAAHRDSLNTSFNKLRDHQEWGLQILESAHATPTSAQSAYDAAEKPSSGRDYLRGLSAGRQRAAAAQASRQQFLEQLEAGLLDVVSDHVALNSGRVMEDGDIIRANLSLLVPQQRLSDMQHLIETQDQQAQHHGLSLRLTGPWPPQSFAPIDFSL